MDDLAPTSRTLASKDLYTLLDANYLLLNAKNFGDSDIDISFKSTSDVENVEKLTKDVNKTDKFTKTDSLTQSDRPSDGYETCIDDSLSEDNKNTIKSNLIQKLPETENSSNANIVQNVNTNNNDTNNANNDIEDLTPTNSRVNIIMDQFFLDVPDSSGKNHSPTGKT